MTRRLYAVPFGILLVAILTVLPGCKKKKSDDGDGAGTPSAPSAPASVKTDNVVVVSVKVKEIRESPLFTEFKQSLAKTGGGAEFDQIEQKMVQAIGVRLADIESFTVVMPDGVGGPVNRMVAILTANKPISKTSDMTKGGPDPRGFYQGKTPDIVAHFADDRTLVVMHPTYRDKYLAGFAKNRDGWPLSADIRKAAGEHTIFLVVNAAKLIPKGAGNANDPDSATMASVQTVVAGVDLNGKDLAIGVRAAFPDSATAGKAKDTIDKFRIQALTEIDKMLGQAAPPELAPLMPLLKEGRRAIQEAQIGVSGSDVTLATTYKVDVDWGAIMSKSMKQLPGLPWQ